MRTIRTSKFVALALAATSFVAAGGALANGYVHPENSEKGYKVVPEHFKSDKSRAQVQAEAADFVKKGGMDSFKSNNYSPAESSGASSKTREQVQNEYLNETPEQRKDRMELYRGRMF